MNLEYTSTFSINSQKHNCSDAFGIYYTDTGYGVCFVDMIWNLVEDIVVPSWEQDQELREEFKRLEIEEEQISKEDYVDELIIGEIIRTDFHEFVHHFLNTHKIENNCCDHEKYLIVTR